MNYQQIKEILATTFNAKDIDIHGYGWATSDTIVYTTIGVRGRTFRLSPSGFWSCPSEPSLAHQLNAQ